MRSEAYAIGKIEAKLMLKMCCLNIAWLNVELGEAELQSLTQMTPNMDVLSQCFHASRISVK